MHSTPRAPAHTTPRTYVIVGGTAGIGLALARERLGAGHTVTVIGRDPQRAAAFLADAEAAGHAGRAAFIATDLADARATWRTVDDILQRHPVIDALVLSAYSIPFSRRVTTAGIESALATYYLARRILGDGLAVALERAERPVIVSLNGVGAVHGEIHWDDLSLERGFGAVAATKQAGRAAELLAVARAADSAKIRYVMVHPGYTRSGTTGLRQPLRAVAGLLAALFAQPVDRVTKVLAAALDDPPETSLSAIDRGRPLDTASFADLAAARRLDRLLAKAAERPT